ncbi:hypothetical protein [Streptomyces sp. NPDC058463]|uniref:hypothetical protein n=1 Tax=Streptomyces sp. NPDC058463 TaxID=3346510 RepID=UPI0036651B97
MSKASARTRLADTAFALIDERGYEQTTVDGILTRVLESTGARLLVEWLRLQWIDGPRQRPHGAVLRPRRIRQLRTLPQSGLGLTPPAASPDFPRTFTGGAAGV